MSPYLTLHSVLYELNLRRRRREVERKKEINEARSRKEIIATSDCQTDMFGGRQMICDVSKSESNYKLT